MSNMDATELGATLAYLGLEQAEAAQLLGVAPRTMRRWLLEGEEMPGPAIVKTDTTSSATSLLRGSSWCLIRVSQLSN